jgi:hypothetical protein
MHSCTAISNRRVCLGGGCVQRGLAEQHRNQAADLREQALKAEKRRADRVRKHQREQKTGKVSNSKKRSKATTHAGSTRNRARDVDLTRYAASHHHRDQSEAGASRCKRGGCDGRETVRCRPNGQSAAEERVGCQNRITRSKGCQPCAVRQGVWCFTLSPCGRRRVPRASTFGS